MSKGNLYDFLDECSKNEDLQARISDEVDGETLVALGVEYGYEFSAEDLDQAAELTDEELDEVAGGGVSRRIHSTKGFAQGLSVRKARVKYVGSQMTAKCTVY